MTKVNKKKSNKFGNKVIKKRIPNLEDAKNLVEKGEDFGETIINQMRTFAVDVIGMGVATIGLAKALAALKTVAKVTDVNIETLYSSELSHFEKQFSKILNEDVN